MADSSYPLTELWEILAPHRPHDRCRLLLSALRLEPDGDGALDAATPLIRARWSAHWEQRTGGPVPIVFLRTALADSADLCLCERVWDVAASPSLAIFIAANHALVDELQRRIRHAAPV